MNQDELKKAVAKAALDHIRAAPGSGERYRRGYRQYGQLFHRSYWRSIRTDFDGAVASSDATAERLKSHGIPVYDSTVPAPWSFISMVPMRPMSAWS